MLRPVDGVTITHVTDDEGYLQELTEADRAKLENVKQRIKKLLAFNKDGRSVSAEEMDAAMSLAVHLARKSGLDIYRLEREMREEKGDLRGTFVLRVMELPGHANWMVQLASVISRALICRMVTHTVTVYGKPNKRTGRRYRQPRANYVSLIGMPEDIEMVDYLYEYIVRELGKQVGPLFKEDNLRVARYDGIGLNGKRYRDEFYRGAVTALQTRLKKLFDAERAGKVVENANSLEYTDGAEDEDAPVPEEMALVPLKEADVEKAMHQHFTNLGKGSDIWNKQRSYGGENDDVYIHNAYMAGHAAGNSLELRKALTDRVVAGALASGE